MIAGIGLLFCIAWAIGMMTLSHPPLFVHLPLLIGAAAMGYGVLFPKKSSA